MGERGEPGACALPWGPFRPPNTTSHPRYQLATTVDPKCAEAWNNAGVLARAAGDDARAEACYAAALAARPTFARALSNLAALRTVQGRAGEAGGLLAAALAADDGYAEVWRRGWGRGTPGRFWCATSILKPSNPPPPATQS